jgi:hypothetical protein
VDGTGSEESLGHVHRLDKSIPEVPRGHKLSEKWLGLRPWFESAGFFQSDDDFVVNAERVFVEFDRIDPQGTAFRYPPLKLPHHDLINFSLEDFEQAIDQIDTVFFALFNMMNDYEENLAARYQTSDLGN